MKWIGILKETFDNEAITRRAIITVENNGTYSVSLNRIYGDGSIGKDECLGQWARSLGAAKKRLIQDTGWKSSDFEWKTITIN
jgi:hypothetical protein